MRRNVLLMISSMRGGGSEKQTLLLLRHLDPTRFRPHLYLTERAGELLDRVPDNIPVHAYCDDAAPTRFLLSGTRPPATNGPSVSAAAP